MTAFTGEALQALREGFSNHSTVIGLIDALETVTGQRDAFNVYAHELEQRLFQAVGHGLTWEQFKSMLNRAPEI